MSEITPIQPGPIVCEVKKIKRDQQRNRHADKQERQVHEGAVNDEVPQQDAEIVQHIDEIV